MVLVDSFHHNYAGHYPLSEVRGSIQKFPDWQRGARTANSTALCH